MTTRKIIYIAIGLLLTCWEAKANDDYFRKSLNLKGFWKFVIGDKMAWADPNYDDKLWEEIYVPSKWEDEGFSGYDGYAWYRFSFNFEELRFKKNLYLNLGYIDDVDEVFFNGVKIGFTGNFPPKFQTAYNALRVYPIPEKLINKTGKNTIAVRVFDFTLSGGITNGDIGLYTLDHVSDQVVILDGIWNYIEKDDAQFVNPEYDDSDWNEIIVPGFWKIKDHFMLDDGNRVAWFRKRFTIDETMAGQSLSIHLGKIDDFDEVYINGRFIGSTNDRRGLGQTQSWLSKRIYAIPPEYLNQEGENVIAVRVYDLGGDSGIYSGPVVIMGTEEMTRFIRYID